MPLLCLGRIVRMFSYAKIIVVILGVGESFRCACIVFMTACAFFHLRCFQLGWIFDNFKQTFDQWTVDNQSLQNND